MQAIDNAELISTKLQLWMPSLPEKKSNSLDLVKRSLLSWKTRKPRIAKAGKYNTG